MIEARRGDVGITESALEDHLARLLRPIPAVHLGLEVDGYGPHAGRKAFQHDRNRRTRLAALGWTVLVFTYEDVTRRPSWVREQIRTTLRSLR